MLSLQVHLWVRSKAGYGVPAVSANAKYRARGSATVKLTPEVLSYALEFCMKGFGKASFMAGVTPSCVFQFITKGQVQTSDLKGGNALGLNVDDAPLLLLNTKYAWKDEGSSQVVRTIVHETIEDFKEFS